MTAAAKDENSTGERVFIKNLMTQPSKAIDAFPTINGVNGHQNSHLGSDLKHRSSSQTPAGS
jgi:hypothetical protein